MRSTASIIRRQAVLLAVGGAFRGADAIEAVFVTGWPRSADVVREVFTAPFKTELHEICEKVKRVQVADTHESNVR